MAEAFSGYRRRVRIVPHDARVDVDMEDDQHHFGVSLIHDGVTITGVETRTPRYPWTTCPLAGEFLVERMIGHMLADATGGESQRDHCTHMYDLFVLAARHALDPGPTVYDLTVADGDRLAVVERNGEVLLRWRVKDDSGREGVPGGSFRELEIWSRTLPDDLHEAARMLRRGVMVSGGRGMTMPPGDNAAQSLPHMQGACFTFQPDHAIQAVKVPDTIVDFSKHPEKLLTGERP